MAFPSIELNLPSWVEDVVGDAARSFATAEQRMTLAIALAQRSCDEGGGPFGAAVFESESGRLVAPGVNLVVPASCSAAHAEVVALSIAQKVLGNFDLGAAPLPAHELVTSTEPCAQCFGAILWSGVRRLVCGARGEDASEIGFDEGPKPANWVAELERRDISVCRDLMRQHAAEVLRDYSRRGLPIYNSRQGGQTGD